MFAKPLSALIFSTFSLLSSQEPNLPQERLDQLTPSDRVSFSVMIGGVESNLSVMSVTTMPGEPVTFETDAELISESGEASEIDGGWRWTPPADETFNTLTFRRLGQDMTVNVFTLTPFANGQDDILNAYRVGQYSEKPLRGLSKYIPPEGFIDMQPGMEDIQVSPHFRLGQFICKQQPGHDPTYLLIEADLLLKLETLLEAANDKGWEADTFFVMSGFRTPFYNAAIGNKTTSSRHLFGDAADIYIDHDKDGVMDDLDGDGKITKQDAVALAKLAREIAQDDETNWPAGGIGIYGSNAAHGPFVHIDARGYPARWG